MATALRTAEFRTPEQIVADEEIAAESERHIVADPETGWTIFEATEMRRSLAEADRPENAIADGGLNVPFLWNGGVFRITAARHSKGTTTVTAEPRHKDFEAEVRRRIDAVPFHVLTFYQGFGFICFPEDHAKYNHG